MMDGIMDETPFCELSLPNCCVTYTRGGWPRINELQENNGAHQWRSRTFEDSENEPDWPVM